VDYHEFECIELLVSPSSLELNSLKNKDSYDKIKEIVNRNTQQQGWLKGWIH